jgi:outer membrane protein assembly factor BamB
MPRILTQIVSFAILMLSQSSFVEGDGSWPNWRGVSENGNAGNGTYPIRWSEKENIRWKVPIEGRGGSTPIVVDNKILLTAGIKGTNTLLAYNLEGKLLWQQSINEERPGKHRNGSGSNSSPISDGKFVYAYFKSGDLGCCDLDGKVVWMRNIQQEYGEDTLWWDLGTSPVLTKEAVVVAVMQSGPSFLVAFDKVTGKQLWKIDRMLEANQESNQAYTTPVSAKVPQGEMLLALGADHITAHWADSGKEIWRVGGFNPTNEKNYRSISSPVVVGDLVICPYARGQLVTAVRYSPDIPKKSRVAWQLEKVGADVPTPAVDGERVFLVTDKGDVACVTAKSSETLWSGSLPKNRSAFSSSPIVAGGHVYLTREDGMTFVISSQDSFQLVAENQLEATTVATPVLVNNQILLRTFESLYCIANP